MKILVDPDINPKSRVKTLVLMRHGQSVWNHENRFTGWTDVDLTEQGQQEAIEAGRGLRGEGLQFDVAFTSLLKRAIKTLWNVLEEMDQVWIPVRRSWRLNERHYGSLQGKNKSQMAEQVGDRQVHAWRRSYDVRPPQLTQNDERFPGRDRRYAGLRPKQIPLGESLKDTIERVIPYWKNTIAPAFDSADTVLVVAHGNSLRALVKYFDNISDDEIPKLEVPTGVPLIYNLDNQNSPKRVAGSGRVKV